MSTRIDMTPMVDLGFLLVTFFILTTTMAKPKAMQVVMPDTKIKDSTQMSKIRESEVLTIILDKNDRIVYYDSIENPNMEITNFSKIRKIVIDKNKEVLAIQQQKKYDEKGVIILIKPTDSSKYENLVNMLDEMKITQIKSYAIVSVSPEEIAMLPK
jgi:biopolymer transport protein ExbD